MSKYKINLQNKFTKSVLEKILKASFRVGVKELASMTFPVLRKVAFSW